MCRAGLGTVSKGPATAKLSTTVPISDLKTVLLVDDNPADLRLYARALSEAGYRAITTLMGQDFFGIHHNENPALILLDRTLKTSLSAATVVKILRDIFPGVPVLLFSMSADALGEMKSLVVGFLQKGDEAGLIAAVGNVLDRQAAAEGASAAE